jgi:hypothetical protein
MENAVANGLVGQLLPADGEGTYQADSGGTGAMERLLADIILAGHALIVGFVVIGFVLILIGMHRRWSWTQHFWFRLAHLAAIAIVALQAWLGRTCPLTVWEGRLRAAAGGEAYPASFVGHWLQRLIYYDFPAWMFTAAYTVFVVLVAAAWMIKPPKPPWPGRNTIRKG